MCAISNTITHSQWFQAFAPSAVNCCAALPPAEGLTAHSEAQWHQSGPGAKKAGHTARFVFNGSAQTSASGKWGSVLEPKVCLTVLFMAPWASCGIWSQLCNTGMVTKRILLEVCLLGKAQVSLLLKIIWSSNFCKYYYWLLRLVLLFWLAVA